MAQVEEYDKIIIGIDPGTNLMGYGVLGIVGKKAVLLSGGVIELSKFENHALKLQRIFERVLSLIDNYQPDEVALEEPFYGKNPQSMLKLGRAQGVAMAAALYRNVPIFEYAPRRIKQAITGSGNASKEQVAGMVMRLLELKEMPRKLDTTDALGVALCHYFTGGQSKAEKKYKDWGAFLKDNPDKKK